MYAWKSSRSRLGTEWYNYPSPLTIKRLCYVIAIGKSKTPPGFHNQHEDEDGCLFHYLRGGQMWHRVRGQTHVATRGMVCLMDMSVPIEYGTASRGPADNWWFSFRGKDLPVLFAEMRADRDPLFVGLDTNRVERLFDELLGLIRGQPAGYELKSAGAILALLGELSATRGRTHEMVTLAGRAAVLSDPVRHGIDYITRFYETPLPLKRIADVTGVSMFHFARLFRKETGVTPIEYLNRYRVEQAKRLLGYSSKPISQIGAMVGIKDPTYFVRLFRRHAGMTPNEFRKSGGR